jgi:hypothetical protein
MHLLRTVPDLKHVAIHPDGEHGKRFDFKGWLEKQGFSMIRPMGSAPYGGTYRSLVAGQTVLINPKSGRGDVVAGVEERGLSPNARAASSIPSTPDS